MKNIKKLSAVFIAISLNTAAAFSQPSSTTAVKEETVFMKDGFSKITSFTGKYFSGKVYLKWMVKDEKDNGFYVIYKSSDGINFKAVGAKQGIGVPVDMELAYYFTDTADTDQEFHYKIVCLVDGNETFSSNDISIGKEIISACTCDQ